MNENNEYAQIMSMLAVKGYETLEEWKEKIAEPIELARRESNAAVKQLGEETEFDDLLYEEILDIRLSEEAYIDFKDRSLRITKPDIVEWEKLDRKKGKIFLAALELVRNENEEKNYELHCLIERITEERNSEYFYLTIAGRDVSVVYNDRAEAL